MASNTAHTLFTQKADAYAKYRPKYPAEVFDFILEPFHQPEKIKAVDVGAGTGIASRILAERGVDVIAAEPNRAMIQSAEAHPNVQYVNASAEDLPLVKDSADLITVFQAFHWFNFKKSLKHFSEVLKPSGNLSIVWSYWNYDDLFTAKFAELIRKAADKNSERVTPYDGFPSGLVKRVRMKMLWKFKYLPHFKNVQQFQYKYERDADLDILIGDARSQSYLKHEGPLWDDLLKQIKDLYHSGEKPRLVYSINVFSAQPKS